MSNPENDKAMNARQAVRLRELSDYLHARGRLYMFELLVPASATQLARLGGRHDDLNVVGGG